ncbi:MAG: GtrA family protein [Clostridiales bacterium]|nr:GtrA family protein [Clostridiales bacterium]
MKKLVAWACRKLHIDLSEEKQNTIAQFIRFAFVGLSNTLVSYIIYLGVLLIMSPYDIDWDFYVASVLSFLLSVLWSFYWNRRVVFNDQTKDRKVAKRLIKTYISYAITGIGVANLLLFLWVTVLGIPKTIAPLISLFILVPMNFLLNKYWTFRDDSREKED